MTTNLLIGYPDIPAEDQNTSATATFDSQYPLENLYGGNKTDTAVVSPEVSSFYVDFDLGITTKTVDFIFIAKARLLAQSNFDNVQLKAGTTILSTDTKSDIENNLCGPESEDYIKIIPESNANEVFSVIYTAEAGKTSTFQHSKYFFGKAFDPGLDPNAPATITRLRAGGLRRKASFSFEFSWEGMRYDKAVEMYTKMYLSKRYMPVVLFTRTWHDILMGNKAILCRMTEMSLPPRLTDYCDVSATFEELV